MLFGCQCFFSGWVARLTWFDGLADRHVRAELSTTGCWRERGGSLTYRGPLRRSKRRLGTDLRNPHVSQPGGSLRFHRRKLPWRKPCAPSEPAYRAKLSSARGAGKQVLSEVEGARYQSRVHRIPVNITDRLPEMTFIPNVTIAVFPMPNGNGSGEPLRERHSPEWRLSPRQSGD